MMLTVGKVGDLLVLRTHWATCRDLCSGGWRHQTDLVPDLETLHGLLDNLVPMLCGRPGG
jgi:hypothetical protein